jgi:hypothetical protein
MPRSVTIAVEGPNADRALEDLLAVEGLQGNVLTIEQDELERDGGVLVAIGAVIGIVGGVAALVDRIIGWREKWNRSQEKKRLSVVIEDARGNRLALDNATPEQITAALQTLSQD